MRYLIALFLFLGMAVAPAQATMLLISTTTSTENSGLLEYLTPQITEVMGFAPKFIVTGSGKALRLGMAKDVGVVWSHDDAGETAFMQQGYGLRREKVMYNQFVLIGPKDDPAGAASADNILEALQKIAETRQTFVSRGDDSGTHRKEKFLFAQIDNPQQASNAHWYRELGSGMGATINTAAELKAYTLADEATWRKHGQKSRLSLVFDGDMLLRNPYSVIVVDHPDPKQLENAQLFADWLLSPQAQQAIADYRIGGKPAFVPYR